MSVRTKNPVKPATLLAAIDAGARETCNDVRRLAVPIFRQALPARSGRARRSVNGRVGRTGTGYQVTIAASSRVRYPNGVSAKQVIGWLHSGTGLYGPHHAAIKPRRGDAFHLPGGWVSGELPGYPGRDYFGGAQRAAEGGVEQVFATGARRAARAAVEHL